MKTVKRKAEVGEKILSKRDNMVHEVLRRDWFGVGTSEKSTVPHDDYEVIIEDEPEVIKNDHGTFVVKDEESNAYISAVDVDELKDEAMKRLLTPDQAREKLKLPHRVHPKPSNREHDATDYGGPLGTPIPPHSSHYHQNGLDPLEVMRRTFPPEQYEGFLRGSLLKYTMRYDRKGQGAEDLGKAEFYSEALKRWKEGVE